MKKSAMTPQRPDETTLHAWVDGQLQPDAAAAVAQWLPEHPEEAARMAAIQAQNAGLQALHAPLLEEPVPPHLIRTLQKPALQWRWPHALAAGIMLSLGLGYGAGRQIWVSQPAATLAQLPGFVREAAAAHAVYVPEQRHPVEVAAQQQAHLVQWLSRRLLRGESGQARAQFMYEDQAGQRVTLYISVLKPEAASTSAPASFEWSRDGASHGFYWIEGRQGYALSASLPRKRLQALANTVYQQLN